MLFYNYRETGQLKEVNLLHINSKSLVKVNNEAQTCLFITTLRFYQLNALNEEFMEVYGGSPSFPSMHLWSEIIYLAQFIIVIIKTYQELNKSRVDI